MNFLLRSHSVAPYLPTVREPDKHVEASPQPITTLEGHSSKEKSTSINDERYGGEAVLSDNINGFVDLKSEVREEKYSDVTEDQGWLTIPIKGIPENLSTAADIDSFRLHDRSFVFPGEKIHILACLAASKQDTEVITPFKVAALMSKNSSYAQKQQKKSTTPDANRVGTDCMVQHTTDKSSKENGETGHFSERGNTDVENLIRMEACRHQTEVLLKRFINSKFFVRIAKADEPLWSKRNMVEKNYIGSNITSSTGNFSNSVIDVGHFDGNVFGGLARNTGRCFPLPNGDIVVLLEVNVGNGNYKDSILEVLQFEKIPVEKLSTTNNQAVTVAKDPCGELLKWLLPLDHAPLPARPLSPLNYHMDVGNASQRSMLIASSSTQRFPFGHIRSHSMSTLPQAGTNAYSDVLPPNSKPSFDLEDLHYCYEEKQKSCQNLGAGENISFRGVQLEPERYSVQCGLGGMYLPGKRWRKKVEIVQPIEIHSFAVECNTEDILSVHIKNVSPDYLSDIIVYVDAVSITFDEAPKGEEHWSLPISCIEAGNGHCLPNLALRRGEEHAFILKPATLVSRDKCIDVKGSIPLQSNAGTSETNNLMIPKVGNQKSTVTSNQYAVLVSFRCNYTESRLFLKKPTSWRPHLIRDLMISISSDTSKKTFGPEGRWTSQLPIQELTLQATNLTDEDLSLTVLAPASFTAPPSVVSLNSPATPISPVEGNITEDKCGTNISIQSMCSVSLAEGQAEDVNFSVHSENNLDDCTTPIPGVMHDSELSCTHLWLQSTVPLGYVPALSSAKVKLELLPLKDGIITLDTLQIAVKEKGLVYVPENSLKIHATSSVTTGIL